MTDASPKTSLAEIATVFPKLGLTSFGGPVATSLIFEKRRSVAVAGSTKPDTPTWLRFAISFQGQSQPDRLRDRDAASRRSRCVYGVPRFHAAADSFCFRRGGAMVGLTDEHAR